MHRCVLCNKRIGALYIKSAPVTMFFLLKNYVIYLENIFNNLCIEWYKLYIEKNMSEKSSNKKSFGRHNDDTSR
jgi:hypothetical protein